MSRFPTGVTVVSAMGPAGPAGATANAVASLSLEPPMMLACLDLGSRTLVAVEHARRFGINVLGRRPGGARAAVQHQGPPSAEVGGRPMDRASRDAEDRWSAGLARLRASGRARRWRPRDRNRAGARARGGRRSRRSSSTRASTGRCSGTERVRHRGAFAVLPRESTGERRRPYPAVVAARSASRKITRAETAMIPVSRRTIANGDRALAIAAAGTRSPARPAPARPPRPAPPRRAARRERQDAI